MSRYEWVGMLLGGAIITEESLAVNFPPFVWKLIGGGEAVLEDLREVRVDFTLIFSDAYFINPML